MQAQTFDRNEAFFNQPQNAQMNIQNHHQIMDPPPPYGQVITQQPPTNPHFPNSQQPQQQPYLTTLQQPPHQQQHLTASQPVYYVAVEPPQFHNYLRIPAFVLATISCCCGCWIFSIPAIILAVLPEGGGRSRNARRSYVTSIVFSVLAILATIVFVSISAIANYQLQNNTNGTLGSNSKHR